MEIAQRDALAVRCLLEAKIRVEAAPPGLDPDLKTAFVALVCEQARLPEG
jgi:hypothetical protein